MKYVPNTITILRIVITPVLLVLLLSNTFLGQVWALVLFIIASISDYLDGKLARSFQVGSRLGQYLDPFADKVLVLGTFGALAYLIPGLVPWWAVVLIALRDGLVTGLRTWAESKGRSLRTLPIAKAKTVVQIVYLIVMLFLLPAEKVDGVVGEVAGTLLAGPIPLVLLYLVVAFTVLTGGIYLFQTQYAPPPHSYE